jgi:hypothetical protein
MGRIGLIVLAALMALAGAGLAWGGALLIANDGSGFGNRASMPVIWQRRRG